METRKRTSTGLVNMSMNNMERWRRFNSIHD